MDANERRRPATDEASYWWNRLAARSSTSLSAAERQQFTQWLRESPVHVAEMLHMARVDEALGRFQLWSEITVDAAAEDGKVVALHSIEPRDPAFHAGAPVRRSRRAWAAAALAAGLCALLIGSAWLWSGRAEVIATDRAERREVMLDDGSVVRLEPESSVRVRFAEHERHLVLARGRALFHVARDPARPFVVEADHTVVRAVGTAFGVERGREGIIVTVAEGKVAVRAAMPEAAPAGARQAAAAPESRSAQGPLGPARVGEVLLTAGKQVVVQRSGSAEPVREVDTARALAWSEGRLVFDGVPLGDVAEEFNRYNHIQLRIEGEDLRRRPVSGVFQASDPETLVAFISAGARVTVLHPDRLHIVVASIE